MEFQHVQGEPFLLIKAFFAILYGLPKNIKCTFIVLIYSLQPARAGR